MILLLIGTRKGGFIATSDTSRAKWTLSEPLLKGCEVNHVAHVGGSRLMMAGKSGWWGPALQVSDDAGVTWRETGAIRFDEGRGYSGADLVRQGGSARGGPALRRRGSRRSVCER
jgi:hypothetical protein